MQANYMCINLKNKLDKSEQIEGYISYVSNSIFTVLTEENDLIYFLNNKKYISPMSIVLEDIGSFKDLNLSTDTKVMFDKDKIIIDSHKIDIELENCLTWNSNPRLLSQKSTEKIISNNLLIIEEGIFKYGKHEGIAPVIFNIGEYIEELKSLSDMKIHNNLYSSFISNKIIEFMFRIVNKDIENISITTKNFIGFGPGITPSSDDFLCGFMTSIVYFGMYYDLDLEKIYDLNKDMISEIEINEEEISHNLLKHCVKGNTQKMITNLMLSIIYESDEEEVSQSLREAISFGDMSGTDMVCGIYLGIRLMVNENIRQMFI